MIAPATTAPGTGIPLAVFVLLAMALGACDTPMETDNGSPVPPGVEQGVHAMLMQPMGVGVIPVPPRKGEGVHVELDGRSFVLQMYLVRVDVDAQISSYQAQLKYDTEQLEFVEGTAPKGVMGTFNEPDPGVVRIVGISLEGIPDETAFELRFRPTTETGSVTLALEVEEITGALGEQELTAATISRPLHLVWGTTDHEEGHGRVLK